MSKRKKLKQKTVKRRIIKYRKRRSKKFKNIKKGGFNIQILQQMCQNPNPIALNKYNYSKVLEFSNLQWNSKKIFNYQVFPKDNIIDVISKIYEYIHKFKAHYEKFLLWLAFGSGHGYTDLLIRLQSGRQKLNPKFIYGKLPFIIQYCDIASLMLNGLILSKKINKNIWMKKTNNIENLYHEMASNILNDTSIKSKNSIANKLHRKLCINFDEFKKSSSQYVTNGLLNWKSIIELMFKDGLRCSLHTFPDMNENFYITCFILFTNMEQLYNSFKLENPTTPIDSIKPKEFKVKNGDNCAYKAINMIFTLTVNGNSCPVEIQCNTDEAFNLKNKIHKLFSKFRVTCITGLYKDEYKSVVIEELKDVYQQLKKNIGSSRTQDIIKGLPIKLSSDEKTKCINLYDNMATIFKDIQYKHTRLLEYIITQNKKNFTREGIKTKINVC